MWWFNLGNRTQVFIQRYGILCWFVVGIVGIITGDISKGTATGFPLFFILAFFDDFLIKWVKQMVAIITNRDL